MKFEWFSSRLHSSSKKATPSLLRISRRSRKSKRSRMLRLNCKTATPPEAPSLFFLACLRFPSPSDRVEIGLQTHLGNRLCQKCFGMALEHCLALDFPCRVNVLESACRPISTLRLRQVCFGMAIENCVVCDFTLRVTELE